MQTLIENFHWIRPAWLWALLPLGLLLWLGWRFSQRSRGWNGVVDARLLPWLLLGQKGRARLWPMLFWGLLGVLTIFALAGPAWRQLPTPVYQRSSALVVALDLSSSMRAQDIKPSRIARARLKLIDLLKMRQRVSGQTALVAFAGTAYTVTPLTDDVRTIESLVSSLSPDIMPAQGSRVDRAIDKARELLSNAGLKWGDLLLITDGMSSSARQRVEGMKFDGLRVSVMAVGTPEGAPIPDARGGFIKNRKGEIVIARLDEAPLQKLAARGGGIYTRMRIDDADLLALQDLIEKPLQLGETQKKLDFRADRWREEGPWLLLLILPLAAYAARRGFVLGLLVAVLSLPVPKDSWAESDSATPAAKGVSAAADVPPAAETSWWQPWLLNPDQRGQRALEQGRAAEAESLFRSPDWKAAAAYKAGKYEEAARLLEKLPQDSADVLYNRGNALARAGRLEEALKAYDRALELRPQDEDIQYNRKLVEEALKRNKARQDQNQQGQNQQGQNQQGQNQQGQNQQGQNQQGQNQQGQNQQGQNQQGQNQQGQNQQGQNPQGQNPQGQNPQGQNPQGQNPQGQNPQGQNPQGQNPQGQNPQGQDEDSEQAPVVDERKQQAGIERLRREAEARRKAAEGDRSPATTGLPQEQRPNKGEKGAPGLSDDSPERPQSLEEQAEAQWLRRIPDDPGGLLRNKFRYQYSRQTPDRSEDEPW